MRLRRLLIPSAAIALSVAAGRSSAVAQPVGLGAQSSASVASARKSESTAVLWSVFVPGSGHIYAGEKRKGLALLASAGLGASLFAMSLEHDEGCDYDVCSVREANPTGLVVGGAAIVGAWAYGLIDSRRAARRHNERRGLGRGVHVAPLVAASASRTRLGVSMLR